MKNVVKKEEKQREEMEDEIKKMALRGVTMDGNKKQRETKWGGVGGVIPALRCLHIGKNAP